MKHLYGWPAFVLVQILSFVLMVIGWVLLLPWSIDRAWFPCVTAKSDGRLVTCWRSRWLDVIYGNWEDGCLPHARNHYLEGRPDWLRAYLWSAWRNSTNNLRWAFQWKGGPWLQIRRWGWYFQAGWRPSNGWPVLSAGAGNGSPE